jgi:LuxR family maltose regulon positive regulatory protein
VPANVRRARLLDSLRRGVGGDLTLLAAPAGCGKTTLLTSWIAEEDGRAPIAWLSVGPEESDRRRFWAGAVAALGRATPSLRSLAVPPREHLDAFLPTLVNTLADLDGSLTLILDDFHCANEPAVVADLESLLLHAPASLRIVVASRIDPAFRLQRLRLAGRLVEIRGADLAFTVRETHELLRGLGVPLEREDVEALHERTDGWAAGLRLAALSLEGHDDTQGFIAGFAGGNRAVSDYLLTEVVSRQPAETLELLMRVAIVDQFTGDLADALAGTTGSDRRLSALARDQGLVTAVDTQAAWYRINPLLREVLRLELENRHPDEVCRLHAIAARWHLERALPVEAVSHGIEARDWAFVADALGGHWLSLVMRGHGPRLREMIANVPVAELRADAELALAAAGLALDGGHHPRADDLLAVAHERADELPGKRRRRFAITCTATTLYRARMRGDMDEALSAARVALDESWEHEVATEVRALTLANRGIAEFWSDELPAARDDLTDATALARDCDNDYILFLAQSYAAIAAVSAGWVDEAVHRGEAAIELAEQRGWTVLPHATMAYLALATARLWSNQVVAAEELLDRARAAACHSTERLLPVAIVQVDARLRLSRGEPLTALERLLAAKRKAGEPLPRFLRAATAILEAEARLAIGEVERAHAVLADPVVAHSGPDGLLGLARLELAAGDPGGAIRDVVEFLADERGPARPFARVEAAVIDAIARDAAGDDPGARRAIEHALDLAEPRAYIHPILRHGAPVRSLLRRHLSNGTAHRALAGDLLAALDSAVTSERPAVAPLLEPLSERELTVLRYLPTMMSNAEIAAEMFVSVNTVKTHLKHVYRKLSVTDRRGAVARSRELRLLSPGLGDR